MCSNDALIAWARKDMLAKADRLRKKRSSLAQFEKLTNDVNKLFNNKKKPLAQWQKRWAIQDLKNVITWKQGPYPVQPFNDQLSSLSKGELQQLYQDRYEALPDPLPEASSWSDLMQRELDRLETGEIEDFETETGLKWAMERDEEEIAMRLNDLPSIPNTFILPFSTMRTALLLNWMVALPESCIKAFSQHFSAVRRCQLVSLLSLSFLTVPSLHEMMPKRSTASSGRTVLPPRNRLGPW